MNNVFLSIIKNIIKLHIKEAIEEIFSPVHPAGLELLSPFPSRQAGKSSPVPISISLINCFMLKRSVTENSCKCGVDRLLLDVEIY